MGIQLYFPNKSASPLIKSVVVTISQLLLIPPISYLPALLWLDDLNYLHSSSNSALHTVRSTIQHLFQFCLLCLPVWMSRPLVLSNISSSVFQCTPVITCPLSPAPSLFLFLMSSSNHHWNISCQNKQTKPKPPFDPKSHFTNVVLVLLHMKDLSILPSRFLFQQSS